MSKNMKIIPELRFPEFENDGEWVGDSLLNIAKFRRGSFPQPYGLPEWYDDNGMPFIQVYDVNDDFRLKPETKNKISKLAAEQSVFIPKGTVIITIQGSIGRVAITQYDAYIDRTLLVFEKFYFEIDKVFFAYVLFMLFEIEKEKAPGGIIKTITKEVLSDFIINIPNLSEQQKIASCLSSLDEVISAHSQKLDLLKDHKKGLMQNLFPQSSLNHDSKGLNDSPDYSKVPKYRFPEFIKKSSNQENQTNQGSDNGEWVDKKLGDVATFLKGKGISKSDVVENGNLPCIRYGELYTHYNETISEIKSYTNLSAEDLVLSEPNDVIIPASGETQIDIATASCVVNSGIALGGDLNIIRSEMNGVFLSYYLNNAKKREIAQMAQGISVVHLYPSQLQTLSIAIPKYQEQQKIASCLSSLDALITAQAEKIEQLKLHKKGLMQGLFPKLSEL